MTITVQRGRASVDAVAPTHPLPSATRVEWLTRYIRGLVLVDAAALCLAAVISLWLRFGSAPGNLNGISYYTVAAAIAATWIGVLALSRCYEARFVSSGPEEFRRLANASIRLIAVVALFGYATRIELARGFVAIFLPLGLLLLLVGRLLARGLLQRRRRQGRWLRRVLVVGSPDHVQHLVDQLRREPSAGFQVVGACLPGGRPGRRITSDVPVVGALSGVVDAMKQVQADTVAVASSPGVNGEALRNLSYELEGTGIDLLVAPALTNITGSRINIRPVGGLPLLHLDEPELSGARKGLKLAFDLVGASLLMLLLVPFLLALSIVVRLSSSGPALFTQERVGRDGRPFKVYKFRSMYVDAEDRLADLQGLNEHDGVLFKVRADPRITPAGRWLRKLSLDEFPQLFNVLKGEMSLVGPRPPLASEVARYEGHAHRRLLVKPGITGLWQVSGRSDLSWDDTVRLDLQYVENWSLALDISILLKTASAVFAGRGAY